MQIGIDLGASKIEYVLLDDVGNEHHRERTEVPKNYQDTLSIIKKIVIELERKAGKELPVGVCHPGIHSIQTGLVKNAPNSFWIMVNLYKEICGVRLVKKFIVKMMQTVLLYQKQ